MLRLVLLLIVFSATGVHAQLPQTFENLKVLPRDIPRDSLVSIMRNFSFGLNVRCVYCHVGEDNPTLAGVDFKSDEKLTKRTAREMMRMVGDINRSISAMPERSKPIAVRCATCHQGKSRPITLEDSVYQAIAALGARGGIAIHDTLRAQYFGRSAYDFNPGALVRLAERLYAEKRHEDAVVVLLRNTELYPRAWNSFYELGRNYEALNRKDDAIAAYRATLERLPNHGASTQRLRALTGGG